MGSGTVASLAVAHSLSYLKENFLGEDTLTFFKASKLLILPFRSRISLEFMFRDAFASHQSLCIMYKSLPLPVKNLGTCYLHF